MKFISRSHIDDVKWNKKVCEHNEFRHYYLTYFLDESSKNWEALVNDDYSLIWPLPFKSFPLKRLYQPTFAQQLGPLVHHSDKSIFEEALRTVKKRFVIGRVKFHDSVAEVPNAIQNRNIELSLRKNYEEISSLYNRNIHSNLRKFQRSGAALNRDDQSFGRVIELFKQTKGPHLKEANAQFYSELHKIYSAFDSRSEAECWLVELDDKLMAGALILNTNNRLLNLLSISSREGRKIGASHALFDALIQKNCQSNKKLDFEGSNNDNLAFFYQSFGGTEKVYLQHQWSRLPWPIDRIL